MSVSAGCRWELVEQRQKRVLESLAGYEARITEITSLLVTQTRGDRLKSRQNALIEIITRHQRALGIDVQVPRRKPLTYGHGSTEDFATTSKKVEDVLVSRGVETFALCRVPSDYYDQPLEYRQECINASSVHHLCKSMVMENTQAPDHVIDCSDPKLAKYYLVIVQYTAKLNQQKLQSFLHGLNNGTYGKKKFHMRLAPPEVSQELTGYVHGAVTPPGMLTDIPIILSQHIAEISPDFFWLGGGDTDLKLGMRAPEFVSAFKPFVCDCTY
ncbi:hypothetical protein CYMTET_24054 [Cymbomonas tetramitiformis]|uniref:YbaK/aminoacyl-tRNA synthetase-associated domain-containing protein n=1 Tax=Cymbomonas tetramitiformis TaxID=36881 RepID=A0AAE0FWX2_9CHLO|nr:hypothetical protein CYMTET_24054 [Cymbomonas tetramitiformis]